MIRQEKGSRTVADDMKELIPKSNGKIGRKIRVKGQKTVKSSVSTEEISLVSYSDVQKIDPFSSTSSFIKYSRAYISNHYNTKGSSVALTFDEFSADIVPTTNIMDNLMEANKENVMFLDAWLEYYVDNHLKGKKAKNLKYTSFYALRDTFKEFNSKFYVPR